MKELKESKRVEKIEKKWGRKIEELLYEWHWKEELTHKEIGKKLGIPRSSVTRWFKKLGVPTQDSSRITVEKSETKVPKKGCEQSARSQRKGVNESFFEEWTEDMAYVLGYFVADGCVFVNSRGSHYLEFDSTDKELIEKVKKILDSQNKIGIRKRPDKNWKDSYRIQIGSKKMFADLKELGFGPRKTDNLKFPQVPKRYISRFVRGYFDGDGCVFFKDYTEKDKNDLRVILSSSFRSNSHQFLIDLKNNLQRHARLRGGSITEKERGTELSYSKKDSIRLFEFMYRRATSDKFLERKYRTFQSFFNY